jgi:polysaccharide export outer membrane protein
MDGQRGFVLLGSVLLWTCIGLSAVQAAGTPDARSQEQSEAIPEAKIGTGDLLQVSVFGAPDFDREVRVNSAGEVALPLLGPVNLSGMTISEAKAQIEARLKASGFFRDPQVSVQQKESAAHTVTVLGEVQKPGIYPLIGARTLYDVISTAGGTTPAAGKTVTITRSNKRQTVELSYEPKAATKTNVTVLPGDSIMVSKAGIVYVVGDVRQPSGIVMNNSEMTVLQALALARGPNRTANLPFAKLIRKSGDARLQIPISLTDIIAAKAPDPRLQPNDILFVPFSREKAAFTRGLEAILQVASRVAIYRY